MNNVMEMTKELAAVVPISNPSPAAFLNLFDEGDAWIKTKG